jgi:hypothetical protein
MKYEKILMIILMFVIMSFSVFAQFEVKDLSSTDNLNWVGTTSVLGSVMVDDNLYTGFLLGKFGMYNISSNEWIDLSGTDINNWVGTSTVSSLVFYDDKVYTGISGKFGVYNISDGVLYNLNDSDIGNFFGVSSPTLMNIIPSKHDKRVINNKLYFYGSTGKFAVMNLTDGLTYDLSGTDNLNWVGTSNINNLIYDETNNIFYTTFAGSTGKLGYFNITSNEWIDLSGTDVNNWYGLTTSYTATLGSDNKLYVAGYEGVTTSYQFGVYNISDNTFTNLNTTSYNNWSNKYINLSGTLYFNPPMLYISDINDCIYLVGFDGFDNSDGVGNTISKYNITSNIWYDLSLSDTTNLIDGNDSIITNRIFTDYENERIFIMNTYGKLGMYDVKDNLVYDLSNYTENNFIGSSRIYWASKQNDTSNVYFSIYDGKLGVFEDIIPTNICSVTLDNMPCRTDEDITINYGTYDNVNIIVNSSFFINSRNSILKNGFINTSGETYLLDGGYDNITINIIDGLTLYQAWSNEKVDVTFNNIGGSYRFAYIKYVGLYDYRGFENIATTNTMNYTLTSDENINISGNDEYTSIYADETLFNNKQGEIITSARINNVTNVYHNGILQTRNIDYYLNNTGDNGCDINNTNCRVYTIVNDLGGNWTLLHQTPETEPEFNFSFIEPCNQSYILNSTGTDVYFNYTSNYESNIRLWLNIYNYENLGEEGTYNLNTSNLYDGNYKILLVNENINYDTDCYLYFCVSNYVKNINPCIDNYQIITYNDTNNCNIQYDKPLDDNTTLYCVSPPNTDRELWLLIFLIVMTLLFGGLTIINYFAGIPAIMSGVLFIFASFDYFNNLYFSIIPLSFVFFCFAGAYLINRKKRDD